MIFFPPLQEYLPSGTIENLLQAFGPLHNDVLKKYTRQIVEGVSYLHDNGVVHR
jgi:mitogen-activated protein kinase kinase kinase 3